VQADSRGGKAAGVGDREKGTQLPEGDVSNIHKESLMLAKKNNLVL
jgi:hypothetical protein